MSAARSRAGTRPDIDVFIENLPGNVYRRVRRVDGSYFFEYLSSGLFRQFGIDHERLLREEAIQFDWVHPDDRARMVSDLEISAAMLSLLDHRIRVVGHDGRVHWARGIGRPHRRAAGTTVWDGIVIDVTREVEAEAALRVAKEEADRAHGLAAVVMRSTAMTLGPPIRELARVLDDALALKLDPEVRRALRTCQVKVATAARGLNAEGAAGGDGTMPRPVAMTARQTEVLGLIVSGLSNKLIAQRLGITPGTAKLHVAAVLRAVGVTSRRELRSS